MSLSERFAAVARPVESRVANPLVKRVLASPLHPLLSWRFLVLSYEGRKSGTRYETPVAYWEREGEIVLTTPAAETNWWRNFRTPHDCRVLVRGEWRTGVGAVVDDTERVREHLAYATRTARRLTLDEWPSSETLDELAEALVLVRVA